MPWGYGQSLAKNAEMALVELRKAGMLHEASILGNEINVLRIKVMNLQEKVDEAKRHR